MAGLRLGACLSLTGRYARFGRQAANGLRAWRSLAGDAVDLQLEDDGSSRDRLGTVLRHVAAECELVLGPYSTELMREAGKAIADLDGLLWNHGGAGDDVQRLCPGRIVSIPAPASRYAQPFVRTRAAERPRAPLWVVRGPGRFGGQVAAGALCEAERMGLETVSRRAEAETWFECPSERWDLISTGRFEDDVAIVRQVRSASTPPRALCSVAAGVRDFASMVEADEIYGVAQWFPGRDRPPELGPSEPEFLAVYRRVAGACPDYPAVQAAAAAALAVHCAELAGSVQRGALWSAAQSLNTTTLFGRFAIDPRTGAQIRHSPVLLRWRAGELSRPPTARTAG